MLLSDDSAGSAGIHKSSYPSLARPTMPDMLHRAYPGVEASSERIAKIAL
jgi:hypothetical protein